jgi:muramoyltetrapeptide carboxypeptidase LdcA involved in peptidoglycan recycling
MHCFIGGHDMIYPANLCKGSKIGVTATSAGFDAEVDFIRLESGIKHFEELGYPVIVTDNVRKCCKGRSSDGPTRAKELMQLFETSEIKAVFAASGGEYLFEMLPYVDFERMKAHPKWVQGFSDTTGLLFTMTTNLELATLYSNNFGALE